MTVACVVERPKMAKRKADKPELVSVKLPADVIDSARIVSAYTGETMADLLGNLLRPQLAKMEREEAAKRARQTKPKGADA